MRSSAIWRRRCEDSMTTVRQSTAKNGAANFVHTRVYITWQTRACVSGIKASAAGHVSDTKWQKISIWSFARTEPFIFGLGRTELLVTGYSVRIHWIGFKFWHFCFLFLFFNYAIIALNTFFFFFFKTNISLDTYLLLSFYICWRDVFKRCIMSMIP
jgi:hypothetical protein